MHGVIEVMMVRYRYVVATYNFSDLLMHVAWNSISGSQMHCSQSQCDETDLHFIVMNGQE